LREGTGSPKGVNNIIIFRKKCAYATIGPDTMDGERGESPPRAGGGGGGAAAGKRQRRMSASDSWEKIKELGWCRTEPYDKEKWETGGNEKGVHCVPCKKHINYGGTFANIINHSATDAHKTKAALEKKAQQEHPDVGAMLQSPVGIAFSPEESKLNARAVLALSALRFVQRLDRGGHAQAPEPVFWARGRGWRRGRREVALALANNVVNHFSPPLPLQRNVATTFVRNEVSAANAPTLNSVRSSNVEVETPTLISEPPSRLGLSR